MKRWKLLVAATLATISTQGYALFDAQVLYGQRTGKFEATGTDETLKGNEIKAAVHLSPIPLVPVGFGVSLSNVTYPEDTTTFAFKDFQGLEASAELTAWVPIPGFNLKPYAKLGYVIYGAYGLDGTTTDTNTGLTVDTKAVYKPSGTSLALGLSWSPLPLVGFLLEYDSRNLTLKPEEFKVGGQKVTMNGDIDNKNSTVLVGVEVGL